MAAFFARPPRERARHRLIACTSLPGCVPMVWRGRPTVWRGRHRLLCCWRILMPAGSPGRTTLAAMARGTPAISTAWRFGRLRHAASWTVHLLVRWLAQERVATLPAPTNGRLALLGDGRHADPRGTKHPVAPQGRNSQPHPGFFGLRCVLLMAAGDGSRLPGGLRRRRPQRSAGSRSDNALWRAMVAAGVPPPWATLGMGGGEGAEGAQAHRAMGKARDTADTARRWGWGLAIARPWTTLEDHALNHLVPPVPPQDDQGTRVPREGRQGRKTCGTSRTCWWRRPGGDVTVVRCTKGRPLGPQPPPILGTHLAAWTPGPVVGIDHKRWAIALMHWERKAGLGVGEPQGSGDQERREQSVGIAVLASLWVLRLCHPESVPGQPWSIFQLQHTLRLRAMTNPVAHQVKIEMGKTRKAA